MHKILEYGSIENIKGWDLIKPDSRPDWIDKVDTFGFFDYLEMGNEKTKSTSLSANNAIFKMYSPGVKTACDPVAYNFSKDALFKNMKRHTAYCKEQDLDNWVNDRSRAIKDYALIGRLKSNGCPPFDAECIRLAAYRPFFDQHLYFDNVYNQTHYRMDEFVPCSSTENLFICVPTKIKVDFSVLVTAKVPDLHIVGTGQCFPLYYFKDGKKIDNITDYAWSVFQKHYEGSNGESIKKIDIFDYVYAVLHHTGYRDKFGNNLRKYLPRIPLAKDFWGFKNVGSELRKLHLKFDKCPRAKLGTPLSHPKDFTKITLKKSIDKKSVSVYANSAIIFEKIDNPKYRVNGRTPLEWVADQYKKTVEHGTWVDDPCAGIDIIPLIERAVYMGRRSDELVGLLPDDFLPSDNWVLPKSGLDEHIE